MKISKYKLSAYLIVGIIISLNLFVIKPILKDNYFTDDVFDFKRNSWKYTIGISLIIFVVFTIFAFKKNKLNRNFIIFNLMSITLITFFGKGIIDGALLYANLKIKTEKYTKTYIVLRHDLNKVFHIYDNKTEFIVSDEQLKKIDAIRINNSLKSLYNLQNNDTLNINYKRGLLNVKFLK